MAQLHPISELMAAERQLDVVVVHGLGEHWQGTWRRSPEQVSTWPEWSAEEFGSRIGVWSLSYPASKTRWACLVPRLKGMLRGRHDPEAGGDDSAAHRRAAIATTKAKPAFKTRHLGHQVSDKSSITITAEAASAARCPSTDHGFWMESSGTSSRRQGE